MRIAIIGCGWVGQRLANYWKSNNHHVIATTTSPEKLKSLAMVASEVHLLDFTSSSDGSFLSNVDLAIFSMPISKNSWHQGFEKLDLQFPKSILFSSTGIYPQLNKVFSEDHTENLRADILASEIRVRNRYPQTNILRLGGLMGDERSLKNIFKNTTPQNPHKPTNYIHYEDIIQMVDLISNADIQAKTWNAVAPEHPSIAEVLNLELPSNNSMNTDINQRIISSEQLIQNINYKFIHPNPKYF